MTDAPLFADTELGPPLPRPDPTAVHVSGRVEVHIAFEADLRGLIARFPQEWEQVTKRCAEGYMGYKPVDAPDVFLHDLAEAAVECWFHDSYREGQERKPEDRLLWETYQDVDVDIRLTADQRTLLFSDPPLYFCAREGCGKPSAQRWCSVEHYEADAKEGKA